MKNYNSVTALPVTVTNLDRFCAEKPQNFCLNPATICLSNSNQGQGIQGLPIISTENYLFCILTSLSKVF